jgi:hypothetical protein
MNEIFINIQPMDTIGTGIEDLCVKVIHVENNIIVIDFNVWQKFVA